MQADESEQLLNDLFSDDPLDILDVRSEYDAADVENYTVISNNIPVSNDMHTHNNIPVSDGKSILDDLYGEPEKYNRDEVLNYIDNIKPSSSLTSEAHTRVGSGTRTVYEFTEEKPRDIDDRLTTGDMLMLIYAEIQRKKIAGHHITSMNSFYSVGIKQICTKIFADAASKRIKNTRDRTDEDREIAEIAFNVNITNVDLCDPVTHRYKSGSPQLLTPGLARLNNLTYSCHMNVDMVGTKTAYYKNGTSKTVREEIKSHRIASVPCMVGTEQCTTYKMPTASKKMIGEDPRDPGGYFIIRGQEYSINTLENIANNTFHVFKNAYMNEIARGTFLSKPGDYFENSYQIILRYLNNGAITLESTTGKIDKFEIPFFVVFRALGMTSDRDIVNEIVYGVENTDQVTTSLLEILENSFKADYGKHFNPITKSTNQVEIVNYIAKWITENANTSAAVKDDNVTKYINTNFLSIADRYIFPHIGTGIEHRIKKLRFLGHLIYKLLGVANGIFEPTDRDSLDNKRKTPAGPSVSKTFKTDINFTVFQEIKKHLAKDFRLSPFSQVQLTESIKAAINSDDLERMLTQAITTGNKTINIKRHEITNRISSTALYHKNDLNVFSTLNTIDTPNTSASKQNDRADQMRRVHSTYCGYIDIVQSADTGERVGMSKQEACMTSICEATSSYVLKDKLCEDPDIIALSDAPPGRISAEKLAKVFVNGDWIGCCRFAHELVSKYQMMRRFDYIHHLTTIIWEPLVREVYFWTDMGRLMRPLMIVYNNIAEYIENWRHGDKSIKFKQWIKLTKEHIRGLQAGKLTMDDLRRERVIEYISPGEQKNAYISPNIDILRANVDNIRCKYTHCGIDQDIFGIVTLASPMANHSNATRITFWTNHGKQSAGWAYLNYPYRIDKNVTLQHYNERPLVTAFSDLLKCPIGHNCTVALACVGENVEDSIVVNQSSVDVGMFNASFYTNEKSELEKGEDFGGIDFARTLDIKKDATYAYIQNNGAIAENITVKKNYVLIAKVAKLPKAIDQYQFVDKSIVYHHEEEVYIERVIYTRNADDAPMIKVKMRHNRDLWIGDKLSNRMGNKGIVSQKWPRCDMYYCEDGLVPDLIVNPHSIPTRMAVNQLIECVIAMIGSIFGIHIDATSFQGRDLDSLIKLLSENGINYAGHRRMYDGTSGEWLDSMIFIGPTLYTRLQKFVLDENYASANGPTSALTLQPLDGKNNNGGLRIGEMEVWALVAHGVMTCLFKKLYDDSDGTTIYICRNCGNRAVVNEKLCIYKCKECEDLADIVAVNSSWVANLFFNETSAMNVKMNFELEPHTFSQMQQ